MSDSTEGIRCDISDEPEGGRRYVLEVPACAVALTQAFIDDLLSGRYRGARAEMSDEIAASLAAFRRLLEGMS